MRCPLQEIFGKSVRYALDELAVTYMSSNCSFASTGPGAYDTYVDDTFFTNSSINASGQVTGFYTDSTGDHGFVYSNGTFITIDVPGATFTQAISINDSGQVAGGYYNNGPGHGFIATPNCAVSIDSLTATPAVLWPPNHKMVPVSVKVSAHDSCGTSPPVCKIISVSSNEPIKPTNSTDWKLTGDLKVKLRAERQRKGSGRVYTLTVLCSNGASAMDMVTVTVPHDQGKGGQ